MRYLVLSCSLNPQSRSRALAHLAYEELKGRPGGASFVDLKEHKLPICDGDACFADPQVTALGAKIRDARVILVAAAIYNYDLNSAAKNCLELTGKAWEGKLVGFLCAAGGQGSYMAVMPFANSLMLDYRCYVIPRFVYAPPADPGDEDFGTASLKLRIAGLTAEAERVASGLFPL
jgi:FMN reductase